MGWWPAYPRRCPRQARSGGCERLSVRHGQKTWIAGTAPGGDDKAGADAAAQYLWRRLHRSGRHAASQHRRPRVALLKASRRARCCRQQLLPTAPTPELQIARPSVVRRHFTHLPIRAGRSVAPGGFIPAPRPTAKCCRTDTQLANRRPNRPFRLSAPGVPTEFSPSERRSAYPSDGTSHVWGYDEKAKQV